MDKDVVIRVESLSKRYTLGRDPAGGRYTALRDVLAEKFTAPWRSLRRVRHRADRLARNDEFWALRDVSFSVQRGEVVGIIGRNGAGKSTLLKILSRITEPTKGRITLRGRVASLLEVGTGFHPELTGRENIFLNGAILGMARTEIRAKFDEIVAFAEVERFLDTPVKRYSSGMYVRLAFAVAAHLEPEILIVDEVLAVGDMAFQKKCLGRIQDVARGGRTVLFVSHNMGAVRGLCDRGILLASGSIQLIDSAARTIAAYISIKKSKNDHTVVDLSSRRRAGSGEVQIIGISIADGSGEEIVSALIGEPVQVQINYRIRRVTKGTFFLLMTNSDGIVVLSSFQRDNHSEVHLIEDGSITVSLSGIDLAPGLYTLSGGLFDLLGNFIEWVEEVADFEILARFHDGRPFDHRLGLVTRQLDWSRSAPSASNSPTA